MLQFFCTKKVLTFCLAALCLSPILLRAQTDPAERAKRFLPKIAPLSPNVAALGKFGEYSVNLFKGIPDISIPLYEVKSGSLSVPISLSYNASGIRPTDKAGFVGLNWSLSSGGVVSRSMQGQADELFQYQSQAIAGTRDVCVPADATYLNSLENGVFDVEPDIFSYSMPGSNGKFLLGQNGQTPYTIPYAPIQIKYPSNLSNFAIKDEDGNNFQFGSYYENTRNDNSKSIINVTTAWYLQEMQSPNATDKITFTYQDGGTVQYSDKVNQLTLEDNVSTGSHYSPYSGVIMESYSLSTVNTQAPNQIFFQNGRVDFIVGNYSTTSVPIKRINQINVYELRGTQEKLIKRVNFVYSFFKNRTGVDITLKLDGLDILDANGTIAQKYRFQYWTNSFSWQNEANAVDYWGYYNDKTNNTNLIPQQSVDWNPNGFGGSPLSIGGADRTATTNPLLIKEGVLKQIIFPTGGYTEFDYEGNRYYDYQKAQSFPAGGIRVKTIKNYDGTPTGAVITKTYKYGLNETGLGEINNTIKRSIFQTAQTVKNLVTHDNVVGDSKRVRTFTANPVQISNAFSETPVVYPYVTEYNGTETNNAGKIKYQFTFTPDNYARLGNQSGQNYKEFYFWKSGWLLNKNVYEAGNANPIATTTNEYVLLQEAARLVGAVAFKHQWVEDGMGAYGACGSGFWDEFTYRPYTMRTGVMKLSKSIETQNPGNFQTTKAYVYHTTDIQPLEIREATSKGDGATLEMVTTNKYTGDLKTTDAVIGEMYNNRNMRSTLIESHTTRNSVILSKLKNVYRLSYNGRTTAPTSNVVLDRVEEAPTGTTLESKIKFDNYDLEGNLTQFTPADNIPGAYIWGYKNQLPIAEVKNATNNLTISSSPETKYGTLTISAGSTQAPPSGSLTTSYADKINLSIRFGGVPGSGSETVTLNYSLTGPSNRSGSLCRSATPSGCNNYTIDLLGMPVGTYTLSVTVPNNSIPAAVYLDYSYVGHKVNTTNNNVEVYHQNFEEDADASTAKFHTGFKCNFNRSYTVNFPKPNTRSYLISWHEWDATNAKWVYKEESYTGSKTFAASLYVDDIRVCPAEAHMTTYTYHPNTGITSSIDANGRTTYYEYDPFNRLSVVKDDAGHIIKTYQYEYKN